MQKVVKIMSAQYLYAVVFLTIAKLTEGNLFQGCIKAWMVTAPVLLLTNLIGKEYDETTILLNPLRTENPQNIIKLNIFLLELKRTAAVETRSSLMLQSYMEIHKQTCNREDCPLRN